MIGHTKEMRGGTLIEAIVTLVLGLLLVQMSLGALARGHTLHQGLLERADALKTVRIVRWVLRAELSKGHPGEDWMVHDADSIVLRAYRGVAFPCLITTGRLDVTYRGGRDPDPEKDSVLLVYESGETDVRALERWGPGASCSWRLGVSPSGWSAQQWAVEGVLDSGLVAVRLFESGSSHIADGALRYRRGRGGRQPLTSNALSTPESGIRTGGAGLGVSIVMKSQGGGDWTRWVSLARQIR